MGGFLALKASVESVQSSLIFALQPGLFASCRGLLVTLGKRIDRILVDFGALLDFLGFISTIE